MPESGFEKELTAALGESGFLKDEPMSAHTTFKVGGPADYFLMPSSDREIENCIDLCRHYGVKCHIIGNGSNIIVTDKGIRGAVMQLRGRYKACIIRGEMVEAEAGALLSEVAAEACRAGLSGFEFASGIPGTVGGAVSMNAGAYGAEISGIAEKTAYISAGGKKGELTGEEHDFSYRSSRLQREGLIVLRTCFRLAKGDRSEIAGLMEEFRQRRKEKQPLEYPSAGSIFKSRIGNDIYAWQLIDGCGLRGARCGGAEISRKHCGFIINKGKACAADITGLIRTVRFRVAEKYGIELETEVRIVGEE